MAPASGSSAASRPARSPGLPTGPQDAQEPFHVALRQAIAARGLTLQRIQARLAERGLRVGVTTLSYWQRGERHPSHDESLLAVTALEEILDLPARTLTVRLSPAHLGGRPRRRQTSHYEQLLAQATHVDRTLDLLGHDADGATDTISLTEHWTVGPAGDLRTRHSLHVVRAHREVDRQLVMYFTEPDACVNDVGVRALSGCRLGRVLRDESSNLIVAELLFDRMLRVGETQMLEYGLHDPSGIVAVEYGRFTRRSIRNLVMELTFTAPRLPVRCYRYMQASSAGPREGFRELHLNHDGTVHTVETDVGPGVVGIMWEWQ